jgi:hypothetical protein
MSRTHRIFRAALGHPSNGWALYGLAQSLRMQARNVEAARTQQQFDIAWKNADVVLTASAF